MAVQFVKRGSELVLSLSNITDKNGAPVDHTLVTAFATLSDVLTQIVPVARAAMTWNATDAAFEYTAAAALFTPFRTLEAIVEVFDSGGTAGTLYDTETQQMQVTG